MSAAVAPATALVGVLAVLCVAAARLVPWDHRPPAPVSDGVLSGEQLDRSRALHAQLRPVRRAGLSIGLAVPVLLGLTPAGAALVRLLPGVGDGLGRRALAVLLLVGLPWLCTLPVRLRARAVLIAFGLVRQRARSWWVDQVKGVLLTLVVGWVLLSTMLPLMGWSPRFWWLATLAVLPPLILLLAVVLPPLVERLFARFTRLADGPVRSGTLELAADAGVRVGQVLVADASRRTTAMNAYVSGLGPTRRIVVYDTLLAGIPVPEVLSVVAHELGHARHRDVLRGAVLGTLGAAAGTCAIAVLLGVGPVRALAGASRVGALDSAPLLLGLGTVGSLLASPLQAMVSRRVETRADRLALALTDDPTAFLAVHRRLAATNLEDPAPSRLLRAWYGTHPTTAQRIALARSWTPG